MTEPNNAPISTLTYFTIERSIEWFQQKQEQQANSMTLHVEMVTTSERTFSLETVLDMSYRPFSNGTGLFYLHTNQGVFTYGVQTDPEEFMSAYRRLKGNSIEY